MVVAGAKEDTKADSLKLFTREEVSKHNAKSSTWLTLDNKVYDVTAFLEEHPGGIEVLLENAGRDATIEFEDIGHSSDAREIREHYLIGAIVPVSSLILGYF
ncbi:unnamed protein product [Soboliphyme baturini]|uniref:Cytochrome b5 n=1 Tax=Soboliphyme baturini TaxID=241478 RepID=A0A183IWY0_9BILA|nr:unnamed protein product [Soboliphyme baturini]